MIVVLHYVHNHPIMAADALKHRKVADETLTREKFLDLFKSGHSPSTALESHRYTQYVVALVIAIHNEKLSRVIPRQITQGPS